MTEHLQSRWEGKHPNAQPIEPPFTLDNLNLVLAARPEDFAASAPSDIPCSKQVSELQLRCIRQPFSSLLRENAYSQLLSDICKDWPAVCRSALQGGPSRASAHQAEADKGPSANDKPYSASIDGLPQECPAPGSSLTARHAHAQLPEARGRDPQGPNPQSVSNLESLTDAQLDGSAAGLTVPSLSGPPASGFEMPVAAAAQETGALGTSPSKVQPSSGHLGRAQHCGTAAAEPSSQDASGTERTASMPLLPHIDRPFSSNLQGQAQQDARQLSAAGASIGPARAELISQDPSGTVRAARVSSVAASEGPASSSQQARTHEDGAGQPSGAGTNSGIATAELSSHDASRTERSAHVASVAAPKRPASSSIQHRAHEDDVSRLSGADTSNGRKAAEPSNQHNSDTELTASETSVTDDAKPSHTTDDAATYKQIGRPSPAAEVQSSGHVFLSTRLCGALLHDMTMIWLYIRI